MEMITHVSTDMVDHLAVSLFAWVVPELTICVVRAAFQLALMPKVVRLLGA
jgi:hypothetical protein